VDTEIITDLGRPRPRMPHKNGWKKKNHCKWISSKHRYCGDYNIIETYTQPPMADQGLTCFTSIDEEEKVLQVDKIRNAP
jgi:hypothetical protein